MCCCRPEYILCQTVLNLSENYQSTKPAALEQNGAIEAGTGMGGLTNTSTPTGAHTRKLITPLVPGDKIVTQPGRPDIAMSATAPERLLT